MVLGRAVCRKHPEIAEELLKEIPAASESDLTLITTFLSSFQLTNKAVTETERRMANMIFIAAMFMMYQPQVYNTHHSNIRLNRTGLIKEIASELNLKKSNVSSAVKKIIAWMNVYDDFKAEVLATVQQLKGGGNE